MSKKYWTETQVTDYQMPSENKAVFKKKEIDNTMWINYSYHCQEIVKLEKENKELRRIVLEMEIEAIDLEKENNKLKEVYTNLADTVYTIEGERFIEAANLEYPEHYINHIEND